MTSVEQSVERELAEETEVLGGNLPQHHFIHHKSLMTWPGIEPGQPRWEAGEWPLELRRGLVDIVRRCGLRRKLHVAVAQKVEIRKEDIRLSYMSRILTSIVCVGACGKGKRLPLKYKIQWVGDALGALLKIEEDLGGCKSSRTLSTESFPVRGNTL
jgi:hypothetical protein